MFVLQDSQVAKIIENLMFVVIINIETTSIFKINNLICDFMFQIPFIHSSAFVPFFGYGVGFFFARRWCRCGGPLCYHVCGVSSGGAGQSHVLVESVEPALTNDDGARRM